MRTGSSSILSHGSNGRRRRDARLKGGRKSRFRWLELDGLEARTLLATTPAATAVGGPTELTGISTVTSGGNANSPTIVVDPYNPDKLVAVWGVDLSSVTPTPPHTVDVVEGAYSRDGGANWFSLGQSVAPVQVDVGNLSATPDNHYTQVIDPSLGFDSQDYFYVLSLQATGANIANGATPDGELYLTKFNFSGNTPSNLTLPLPNGGTIYQWVTGSDGATDPTLAVDAARPPAGTTPDPDANNVYVAWSSIDQNTANPITPFNPNRAELVVGTPISNPAPGEASIAFSGVKTVSTGGNFGPQDFAHPQLVINQNDGGQITVAWDDFGSGATASPPFDELMSSLVQPGGSFGFTGQTGPIAPATTQTINGTTVTIPQSTSFSTQVNLPASAISSLDDLTATIALTDQESVQNLSLTLIAPGGDQITLVLNQNNAAGTAVTSQGLPSGNEVGVEGFTTGATGSPGVVVGTIFDDNATKNIFDSTAAGANGNAAPYIGHFQPEGTFQDTLGQLSLQLRTFIPDTLTNFLALEEGKGNINGNWNLEVTNYSPTAPPTGVANQATLEDFSLQLSTGMTQSTQPVAFTGTLTAGSLTVTGVANVTGLATGEVVTGPGIQSGTTIVSINALTDTIRLSSQAMTSGFQKLTALVPLSPSLIDTTYVTGGLGNNFARAVPATPNGVGPGLVMAIDNTLSPTDVFQGRIYAAYVVWFNNKDINTHANPASNTDIALAYSDDGGQTWTAQTGGNIEGTVNNDNSTSDGYSGSGDPSFVYTAGRTQFQPELAVDQTSGTLVVSWRDARDDAANARVATYLATSIDGGDSFSPQTYANVPVTAVDAITGQTKIIGPNADNQSSGNPQRDATFGYGNQMGLAVYNGQVYPVWAGNFNQSFDNNGTITAFAQNIWYQPMVITAGPRVINSTMGPIPLSEAQSGTVSISVTFDRPIDPNTFVNGDVRVFYHDTNNNDSLVPLTVTGVDTGTTSFTGSLYQLDSYVVFINSTAALFDGERVVGNGIPANTTIQHVDNYYFDLLDGTYHEAIILSQPADPATFRGTETLTGIGSSTYGFTQFTVTFDPTPSGQNPATYNYTGTYSYLIAPDDGNVAIAAPIESYVGTSIRASDPMDQNADGSVDDNAVTSLFVGTTPGDVYAVPAPAPTAQTFFFGATSILSPPFDQNTLPIIVPGPQVLGSAPGLTFMGTLTSGSNTITGVVSAAEKGGSPAAGLFAGQAVSGPGIPAGTIITTVNTATGVVTLSASATAGGTEQFVATDSSSVVVDGVANTLDVTFDRPMQVSTFTPGQVAQIMGPTGSLSGPQYFPATSSTGVMIAPATSATTPSVTTSTLTIPSFNGTFTIAHITVQLNAAFSPDSDLTAVLIAPDGTQVTLFSGVGGNGANFINTILDDSADSSITTGAAPFSGTYKPASSLEALVGHAVDMPNPAATSLWVPGVWTLQLTNSGTGASGMLDSWSLSITPQVTVAPVVSTESTVNGVLLASQFTVGFPLQQLSGTYTVQMGPNIEDQFGTTSSPDGLDVPRIAGLQVLRGQDQNGPTTTVHYSPVDLPQPIPAPTGTTGQLTPGQVASTINVPDNFVITGDKTASGASVMQVQINLTYPTDADLTATLTHYDTNGDNLGSVILFSGVGAVGSTTANFKNTVFDDNSATPIQNGSAPFFSTFDPEQSLATVFAPTPSGMNVQGNWVLTIVNNSTTGGTGTFNGWTLTFQKPLPTTGMGAPGSDIATQSFRIFTLGQTDALSSQQWTAVGPASIAAGANNTDPSGRVTGLAIDPSDPSGNTVYAAGASGGIWKTTDFLTTAPQGPTWIPLTDFGPTFAVNIGGIAVFPRNHDPNQSIIIAATGEGDTGSSGVGFLISSDGGATWNLADSTVNVDASGHFLPISSTTRDRKFVGNTSFQVVVDPKATPDGGVIIYAAMSGSNGGIWRSEDTGKTWQLMLGGQATSVALDQESGNVLNPDTNTYVQGNLQVVYAAIQGVGVYMSPNQGQVWSQMLGGIGNPLIFDELFSPSPNVNPTNGPTPNGAQGRITLAVPTATGNAAQDNVYSGWLYALVSTPPPGGTLFGIFVTKDFGQNWTEVHIPTEPTQGYQTTEAIPTNDVTLGDYSVLGSTLFRQGNYNQAMAVDPTDPNIIYVGGTADGNQTGLVRINLTDIWDAHALVANSNQANDGGTISLNSTGPATIADKTKPLFAESGGFFVTDSFLNYIRNPGSPFLVNSSLYVYNYQSFTNNGAGVEWVPFDVGGTDYHRMVTMTDPTTGLPRLIFGNDQGIWSILDNNGSFETTIGASDNLPSNERNGNIQITQFYYGAAQPSTAAALIAGSLFYGSAQDNGGPAAAGDILTSGNITWNGPGGDAAGVATDQQGNGTLYQYWWPCCGGNYTDFFQVSPNGVPGAGYGATYGLLQASGGQPVPDPQWPFGGGANFAVDPVNGQDIVISSAVGRIFTTTNEGTNWFDVGDPAVFGSPNSFSVALAYGAPDPTAPAGVGNLGNFIYVGTQTGQIYVTQNGGGSGGGNNWLNISNGLDGRPVEQIITDPTRGSHDAYAVTSTGVFFVQDSILLANNPTNTSYWWQPITGNLKSLVYSIFGQTYDPTKDTHPYIQPLGLSSIVADWRYAIPNSSGKGTHPVLYVGANSGVYQSLDDGQTWTLFPDLNYGAVTEGGYLPHVAVSSLSTSLGDIGVSTGMPTLAGPYQPFVFSGTLTSGSASVTGVSNMQGLAAGDPIAGTGIPSGTTIQSVDKATSTIMLSANATASGLQNLAAANPTTAPDPDLLMAATYGQGEFAINLGPMIVGNMVTASPTSPPVAPSTLPSVNGPITINGISEISAFGNTTWITVEDITDPAHPVIVAGFNPADGVEIPGAGNSTNGQGAFSIPFNPETYYSSNGVKTLEIFATDNAGSVGNVVTYSFNLNPATQLVFDPSAEPPSSALAGQNFAGTSPYVVVDVEAANGMIANQFNGPVTIVLGNNATGTFDALSVLTVNAVAGVATFNSLAIDTAGTYQLEATSIGLAPGLSTSITIDPAAASQLVWVAQPPTKVTEGVTLVPAPTVALEDQFGNVETTFNDNITIALDYNGQPDTTPGDLSGTLSVPATGGVATFPDLAINNISDPYLFTLVASGGGQTSDPSNGIEVVPPILVPSNQGGTSLSVSAGTPFSLTWTAETYLGTVDTAFNGTVQLAISQFTPILNGLTNPVIGGTVTAVAVNGVVTFDNVILDTAGAYVLEASSGNLIPGDTDVTVTPGAAAGLLVVTEPPTSVVAGAGFGLQLGAEDQYGNPVPLTGSVTLSISTNPGGSTLGGVTTATASKGVATFNNLTLNKVGTGYILQAVSGKLNSATTSGITVNPAAATQLVILAGGEPPTSVNAGDPFQMVVDAEDPFGNVATGFNGSVAITAPTVFGTMPTTTASNGVATFSDLVITTAGTYQLVATSTNLASTTSNNVTVNPNPTPGLLAWATEPPAQVTHDVGFTVALDVEDRYGNLETGYSGNVAVALDNNPTGATLGNSNPVAASNGVATFSGLTIHDIGNGYTLLATIPGVTSPASDPFNVTPIPPASLAVSTPPPSSIQVNQASLGLSVNVLDAAGVVDPDFNGSVTVSIANPSNGTSVTGNTTVDAVAGVATFSNLAITGVGTVTLQISSGSLTPITAGPINVTPGPATKLVVVTEPPAPPNSVTAGTPFGFEVDAEDQYGNVATGFNGTVMAALSATNGATLGGTNPALVVNNGRAIFTGLVVDKAGTGYQIAVSSTGLSTVTTSAFNVTPGPMSELIFPTQSANPITAGALFGLTVAAADAYGNVVNGYNGPISISLFNNPATNPQAAMLNGPLTETAINGQATFSGLSLNIAASGYTIAAAASGLNPGMSNPINVIPAAASQLVVSVPPPTQMTAGAYFGVAIAAEDPFGNLATGFTGNVVLALANNPTGASLTGGLLTMPATGGIANFGPKLTITTAGSGYTLRATGNGLTPVTTGSINVVPGAATQLVVETQPPSFVVPGGNFGLVVVATDSYGNVNPSFAGQVTVAPPAGSGASLGGSTTVTASAGVASFAGLTLSGTSNPVALQVTGTSLTSTATNPVSLVTPSLFAFNTASMSINEDAGSVTFQIMRSGGLQQAVSVNVSTSGGTAVAGTNYKPISETVNFAAGQDSQPITIPILNAGTLAQPVTVNIVLSNPGSGGTLGSPSTATLTILNTGTKPSGSPVTLESVQLVPGKKHKVQGVILGFSGGLDAAEANTIGEYTLVVAGKHHSFTGKGTKVLKLKSAVYNSANYTVALTLAKPIKIKAKKPVQLTVDGVPPAGLADSNGHLIDGNHDGQAGGNAVVVLGSSGATIQARTAAVDVLLEQGPLVVVHKGHEKK